MSSSFPTVRVLGGLLPPDLLGRVVAGDRNLPGMSTGDYHLAGHETAREAANRHWSHLRGAWTAFRTAVDRLPANDPATGLTRERWLTVLFETLGFGRLPTTGAGGLIADGRGFPVSHEWRTDEVAVPVHLLGWNVDLDRSSPGVSGAARRPHAMVQELLNVSDRHLWAVLSNGRTLRLLRDSTSLTGQQYVEFDLEAMFDGEVFADFVLLYLTVHQSRFEARTTEREAVDASSCWLEVWRTAAVETGTRALGLLRDGVQEAITVLGSGFLQHPSGAELSRSLADGRVRLADYHAAVLRLVYRLLFLFVAEDRDALHPPGTTVGVRERYAGYFSTARLRRLAVRRRGDRHSDQWQVLSLVLDALGRDGLDDLGLPGLGGLFDRAEGDVLDGVKVSNRDLFTAVRALSVVALPGQPRRLVDYRNLGAEELGGIYESLLELVPRHDSALRSFSLEALAGNDRKTTGSYYTPTSLIDLVLDETLDPLLDDAQKSDDPEAALLAMTVCDPSCGSAHFLVAAARRMALRLASIRTGDPDPAPTDVQDAMFDVVSRCIYGVDLNPLAADLAKVSLWVEALRPGRPLAFLDHHIKVGNGLLGATPALVAGGIPDGAYGVLEGDEKTFTSQLKKKNAAERKASSDFIGDLFSDTAVPLSTRDLRRAVLDAAPGTVLTLEDLRLARQRMNAAEHTEAAERQRLVADTWCAAFVQDKVKGGPGITTEALSHAAAGQLAPDVLDEVQRLAAQYRFFHWHLEFPEVFDVGDDLADGPGWRGGFTAVVGNPPWERVKLQEKEFFASRDTAVAEAGTAAKRKKAIDALADRDPGLLAEFFHAKRESEGQSQLLRSSGRYPLCGVGDVNTYSVFAEHMRTVAAPAGRMGVITPTGLATDNTTAAFFADTLRDGRLAAFYDFENEAKIFAGVDHRVRFAVTSMTGGERVDRSRFAFVTRHVEDVPSRRFELAPEEVLLLNPNTGTLPVFRTRRDAEITLAIYRRHPVLMRDGEVDGNPWGLRFGTLFHMANASALFNTPEDLAARGAAFDGWKWRRGEEEWLPLYEAKLLSHYDHRFSTYENATQAQLNVGSLPRFTDAQHDDPAAEPLARYWVASEEVDEVLDGRWDREWLLGWRDIARASDARTMVPSVLPRSAVGDKFLLTFPSDPALAPRLQAVWSSLVYDYVVRQKISGTGLKYFLAKQIACPAPAQMTEAVSWGSASLWEWLAPRHLELVFTSERLRPLARDLGDQGSPFRWFPERRAALRAELDAAMFHVYGLARDEVEHVLDSFFVVRKYEERDHGEFRTKRLVLAVFDALAEAARTGVPYTSPIDPPPGQGPRHPAHLVDD